MMNRYDVEHTPCGWYIARWSEDPYCQGSWSQLLIDGSEIERKNLGDPISPSFTLAGEACDPEKPSMVHGAYRSGRKAAEWALTGDELTSESVIVIIGSGASGIAAGKTLVDSKTNAKVILLEARDRFGGRINTIQLTDNTNPDSTIVNVDSGAAWLHQFSDNLLVKEANMLNLNIILSDFNDPLCASCDGYDDHDHIKHFLKVIKIEYQKAMSLRSDNSLADIVNSVRAKYSNEFERRLIDKAYIDILSDSGLNPKELAAYGAWEPGIGDNDHYIKEGYSTLIGKMAEGLSIQYNTVVKKIDWISPDSKKVKILTESGEEIIADRCICTVPVSILKAGSMMEITPPLPALHQTALDHMKLGICDKVILRFKTRWWPHNTSGILRWYGGSREQEEGILSYGDSWLDWLDLTDGVGAPVVMALIYGKQAVEKWHKGRTDEEIALSATKVFEEWATTISTSELNDNRQNAHHLSEMTHDAIYSSSSSSSPSSEGDKDEVESLSQQDNNCATIPAPSASSCQFGKPSILFL